MYKEERNRQIQLYILDIVFYAVLQVDSDTQLDAQHCL